MRFTILITITILLFTSCNDKITSIAEFNSWLNDPDNGCVNNKHVAGVAISAKYLPPNYNILRKKKGTNSGHNDLVSYDSTVSAECNVLSFMMTISPDNEGDNKSEKSVAYKGVSDYGSYADRLVAMNFSMENYIKLYVDGVLYKPVLSTVENLYEISDSRNFIVIFAAEDNKKLWEGNDYLFIYDDPFFNIGKIQLPFKGKDLAKARKIEAG